MSSTQEVGEIFGAGAGPAHAMLRSPTVLIASIGLWGMNVYFFRLFGIDYVKVLKYDLLRLDSQQIDHDASQKMSSRKDIDHSDAQPTSGVGSGGGNAETSSDDEDLIDEESAIMETAATGVEPLQSITWNRLISLSISLLILLHTTYFIWIDKLRGGTIGAVFAFYSAVTVAIMFPLQSTQWLRRAASIVLLRAFELINPRCWCCFSKDPNGPRPVPFVDVFFADVLCSLSKVFFDWGMLLHMAAYYPQPVPKNAHNILIPSAFAAVPYLIRARQCLVMYTVSHFKNDPAQQFSHLCNALKYSTSIFPICLSAYQKTIPNKQAQQLEGHLIILLTINALYALYWDIVMDWGMMRTPVAASVGCISGAYPLDQPRPPSCAHAFMRNRLRFGVSMSALIVVADALLRFSWLLRFYHDVFPSSDSFVLCTQFLEVFRRAIWNLLRVEWENLKQVRTLPIPKAADEEMVSFLQHSKQPGKVVHVKPGPKLAVA